MVHPIPSKIRVYGKEFDEPRLKIFFSKEVLKYKNRYSGGYSTTSSEWPEVIQILADKAKEITGDEYDSVLVNFYRNGDDCIGLHSDKDDNDGVGSIASIR